MGRWLARGIISLIVRLTTEVRVFGREKLPSTGGFVIASNHLGRLDPLLVYHFLARGDIIMFVAEKYQRYALIRWFVKQLDGIWVERFEADFGAVRKALKRLRNGGVLVLAPEGTRSQSGSLLEGRHGVSYLAAKTGAPIYPVGLTGTEDQIVYACLRRLKRSKVVIRVGEAFTLPPIQGKLQDTTLQDYTDEIMCRIAALLPPKYRGVYSHHPRLHALLAFSENNERAQVE